MKVREVAEFRVDEDFASMVFADSEGTRLGTSIRKVEIETTDPRYRQIGQLQRDFLATRGKPFFHGWDITRTPDRREFEEARLFWLRITTVFEPSGEECGTKYDESSACPRCGSGARQVGPLYLSVSRIPKGKDIAKTIAGEVIISRRAKELFEQHEITGGVLIPVRTDVSRCTESSDWFQFTVEAPTANIVPPTRVGIGPFNEDPNGECRCALGDLPGLNLLSQISITVESRGEADILGSRQFIGTRRGLLRPERLILLSRKLGHLIKSERIRGGRLEVAKLV